MPRRFFLKSIKQKQVEWLAQWLFDNTEPAFHMEGKTASDLAEVIIESLKHIEIKADLDTHEANLETHD